MAETEPDEYVTVAQLRDILAKLPGDAIVVMSKDAEGNGFSPFCEVGDDENPDWYVAESSWSGQLRDEEYDADEDGPDGAVPCVVLWPTN